MRMFLGILVVFGVAATVLVLLIVFAMPIIGFGLLAEVLYVAVVLAVAVGTAHFVLPRT